MPAIESLYKSMTYSDNLEKSQNKHQRLQWLSVIT